MNYVSAPALGYPRVKQDISTPGDVRRGHLNGQSASCRCCGSASRSSVSGATRQRKGSGRTDGAQTLGPYSIPVPGRKNHSESLRRSPAQAATDSSWPRGDAQSALPG